MKNGWAGLLLLMCMISFGHAQIVLTDEMDGFSPAEEVRFLLDAKRELTPTDILLKLDSSDWKVSDDPVLNVGYSKSAVWLRMDLQNDSTRNDWVLALESPLLRSVDLFVVHAGNVSEVYQTGDRFEFAARPVAHRNFLFPLTMAPSETVTLLLRAEAPYALVFPMRLYSMLNYIQVDNRTTWIYGLLHGFVLVMSLYNLFVFTATRDISYFHYAMFSMSLNFFLLSIQGFGYQYIWPENIYIQQKSNALSICASLLFGVLFVNTFLRLEDAGVVLRRSVQLLIGVVGLLVIGSFLVDEFYIIQAGVYLTVGACVLSLVAGLGLWAGGRREVRFFALASFVFLCAVMVFALASLGYLGYSMQVRYAVEAGFAVQLVLLSFALADRINNEREVRRTLELQNQTFQRQHLLAKERALEREIHLKEELERRVNERTVELNEALEQLSAMNTQLERMNMFDHVTGLHNQNYFFDVLRREWDRALRDQRCLTLLVVELDGFSEIRERYGLVVQDESLKLVAGLLRETFSRPADVVVRYGDKVFGILLPETEAQGARQLAKGICMRISVAPYDFGLCKIMLSLSVGVATGIPANGRSYKELLETAESALYVAHNNGGSQVQAAIMNSE